MFCFWPAAIQFHIDHLAAFFARFFAAAFDERKRVFAQFDSSKKAWCECPV